MDSVLNAAIRTETGKGAMHRLRQQGILPAVLYGEAQENLSLNLREVKKFWNSTGINQLITLRLNQGEKNSDLPVLVKEVQYDPVKGSPLHLDLYQVSLERKVVVKVPVVLVGEDERINDGSIIDVVYYEVEVSCLPGDIPAKIEVDISKLTMNNAIAIGDLTLPSGVEFVTPLTESVVVAHAPRIEEEPVEEEEAETEAEAETKAEDPSGLDE
ncbi:MAG TPA: 50S ribosomal protein L25 [Firmicutes bacterium]|nr:50S ribosomal protein L25 [Bacillota bacterium]